MHREKNLSNAMFRHTMKRMSLGLNIVEKLINTKLQQHQEQQLHRSDNNKTHTANKTHTHGRTHSQPK